MKKGNNVKNFKISIILIFFLILSIGTVSADSLDDGVLSGEAVCAGSLDDGVLSGEVLCDSISSDSYHNIMKSQEENLISENNINQDNPIRENNNINQENPIGEEIYQDASFGTFTDLKNVLNTSESDIKLNANYKFDESTDSQLKGGISFRNKNFELDGQNNVIDGSNQAGVFIFHNCTVTIRNLKIINAVDALYMDTESTVTTINITFENNTDSSYGAAVCADRSVYSSYNDTFINNNAKFGSAIYLTDAMATISNATFRNDDEIEWALIYSDDQCSIIKLITSQAIGLIETGHLACRYIKLVKSLKSRNPDISLIISSP